MTTPLFSQLRRSRWFKGLSLLIACNVVGQMLQPSLVMALTGGPSQPEAQQFQQAGVSNLVDPFTGDLNYNIPLLTVPGPNGGYPINLGYASGIGVEQEASWVGLGWNINPGAVTRSMRGLPDDFKEDVVIKERNLKPNVTVDLGGAFSKKAFPTATPKAELSGFDFGLSGGKMRMYYNNYNGMGYKIGVKGKFHNQIASESGSNDKNATKSKLTNSLSLDYDSQKGLGFSPSLSYSRKGKERAMKFKLGTKFSSNQGLKGISLKYDSEKHESKSANYWGGVGATFSKTSYVPGHVFPMQTIVTSFAIESDKTTDIINWKADGTSIDGAISVNKLKEKKLEYKAYGLLYSEACPNTGKVLMDFNRENDRPVTKRNQSTSIPIQTNDVFHISGHGTGGTFKALRSDVGIYKDPSVVSKTNGGNGGLELGQGSGIKFGVNASIVYGESYSGPWKDNAQQIDYLDHQAAANYNQVDADPLHEPFYFKTTGEQVARSPQTLDDLAGTAPIAFDISLAYSPGDAFDGPFNDLLSLFAWEPKALKKYRNHSSPNIQKNRQSTRTKRIQNIEYRTQKDMVEALDYTTPTGILLPENADPRTNNGTAFVNSAIGRENHIHEMAVVNPDGSRYTYGLPVYSQTQEDVSFALNKKKQPGKYENKKIVAYKPESATPDNKNGEDHYYSSTTTPAYAQSWLLTQIVSQDYVDLKNDGPSDDDFGYWTKFKYSKTHSNYRWRSPYQGANYEKGYFSNAKDDKAAFNYGEKEIYYLRSVETKTHIAVFELGERLDGLGAHARDAQDGEVGEQSLKYLRNIKLYSKADLTQPISTVHFQYDYSLCPGIPNNAGGAVPSSEDAWITGNTGGKLTLKKVWTTGLDNEKGGNHPYQFAYANPTADYRPQQVDRWGQLQPDINSRSLYMNENPYVNQSAAYASQRAINAATWNLQTITLPSGGSISVDYEADDYAYVQDKKATQMFEMIGFLESNEPPILQNVSKRLSKKYDRIVFRLNDVATGGAAVSKAVNGLDEVYFKAWVRLLQNELGESQYDYVSGFAKVDHTKGVGLITDDSEYGYFHIYPAGYKSKDGGVLSTHPIRKAAWQAIRYERSDLTKPASVNPLNQISNPLSTLVGIYNIAIDFVGFFAGYYNRAALKGYAKRLHDDNVSDPGYAFHPSYIRLNNPEGHKYGGGHRVAKVEIKDNWREGEATYGMAYDYTLPDGTSSGVAEYEPIVGGEENPLKLPIWDDAKNKIETIFTSPDAYSMAPLGEAYYPGAGVGYSRVTVKTTGEELPPGTNLTVASEGITVQEFYTAKDFPVKVDKSDLKNTKFFAPVPLPFVGIQEFNHTGFSQGFTIQLNNMHGKPKSTAVYPGNTNFQGNPTSKTTYNYFTKSSDPTELRNTVPVLDEHGVESTAEVGVTHEFFIAERENREFSLTAGAAINVQGQAPVFVGNGFPTLETSHDLFREINTTKVIYKTGIVKSVSTFADGSTTTAENLVFDAETGQALLTRSNNEWEEPVYSYSYAAHWAYEGMEGAYQNYRAKLHLEQLGGAAEYALTFGQPLTPANIEHYIYPGDELVYTENGVSKRVFVASVDAVNDVCTLEQADGSPVPETEINAIVMRSGHRNMQSVSNGSIVSLENPLTNEYIPLFDNFQNRIYNNNLAVWGVSVPKTCTEGSINNHYSISLMGTGANANTIIRFSDKSCLVDVTLDQPVSDIGNLSLLAYNTYNNTISFDDQGTVLQGTFGAFPDDGKCLLRCTGRVLHAGAVVFTDDASNWGYNYQDVGDPEIEGSALLGSVAATVNPYRYGLKGIWRPQRNFTYLVERLQGGVYSDYSRSNTSKDGEFKHFEYFNWNTTDPISDNPNWQWINHQTAYSPYGFALEEENALEIPSMQLYGYGNSTVTAAAGNADYMEIAFDGFEEYPLQVNPLTSTGKGHLNFNGSFFISEEQAHSGKQSLQIDHLGSVSYDQQTTPGYFAPEAGKQYTVSAWVFNEYPGTNGVLSVAANDGSTIQNLITLDQNNATGEAIDGWIRLEGNFTVPQGSEVFIRLSENGQLGRVWFDDIRLQPFQSSMQTYVYDPATLWLMAILDDRNYASFYNYDEEGNLVQVKKETERGIFTVQSSRQNIRQNQ